MGAADRIQPLRGAVAAVHSSGGSGSWTGVGAELRSRRRGDAQYRSSTGEGDSGAAIREAEGLESVRTVAIAVQRRQGHFRTRPAAAGLFRAQAVGVDAVEIFKDSRPG